MAPATDHDQQTHALILVGHGAYGQADAVERHARALRRLGVFPRVIACHLQDPDGIMRALDTCTGGAPAVLPLLMTDGVAYRLLAECVETNGSLARLYPPFGSHPALAELMASRACRAAAAQGWDPQVTSVLVAAHGSRRNRASSRTAEMQAARLEQTRLFATVAVGYLDQSPGIDETRRRLSDNCVAIGLFVEHGTHGERDVPELLARSKGTTVYDGPIGACPEVVDVIHAQLRTPPGTGEVNGPSG